MTTTEMAPPLYTRSALLNKIQPGWLLNPRFDLTLVLGTAALALLTSVVLLERPAWFGTLLFFDLWLLGYHHVIATFTRLSFDRESFQRNRFLVVGLPPLVLLGTGVICFTLGIWAITTTYFFWQWFHYTRQSYGIARGYRRKASGVTSADDQALWGVMYALPVVGILYRCAQSPDYFLKMPIKMLPVSMSVVAVAAGIAVLTILWWFYRQSTAWREGRFSLGLNLYVLSHLVIYYVSYLKIENTDYGWLVINIWHNAQYLLFVWFYNAKRFEKQTNCQPRLLAVLSQRGVLNIAAYFLTTLVLTVILYALIAFVLRVSIMGVVPGATLMIYQAINFHHYIVDGIIWKSARYGNTSQAGNSVGQNAHSPESVLVA